MSASKTDRLEVKKAKLTEKGFTYETFRLVGWHKGSRVRKQFKSRAEADGEKNRLEVEAANAESGTRAVNTRLTVAQVATAETLFTLTSDPLFAVQWFTENYRPLRHEMPLGLPDTAGTAAALFLAERAKHVRPCVLADYKRTMTDFCAAFPTRRVHEIPTEDVQQFLDGRGVGKKRFNNMRGELCTFFTYCMTTPRRWVRENPVTPIPAFEITRGLPEILTPEKAAEIMAYVESYDGGGDRVAQRGCLAPYFALALFAGIRPDPIKGELKKLADREDLARLINSERGVILIPPEVSKVKSVRQIKLRPNLVAWLARYPLKQFPILPSGFQKMIGEVRNKFELGHDVLRHTFISAHVAKFRSLGEAALEAGNSEAMVKTHYLNMMTDAEGAAFWSIVPTPQQTTEATQTAA
jgi:integrase